MQNCLVFILLAIALSAFGDESPHYDTIIIGAGASGVAAGTTLARNGRHVLIVEAQDRIGGRVYTVPFGDGIVEVGAEWLHGTVNHPAYELAAQNNITILDQDLNNINVYTSDGDLADSVQLGELMEYIMETARDIRPEKNRPLGEHLTECLHDYIAKNKPELQNQTDYIEQFLALGNLAVGITEGGYDWNDVSTWELYVPLEGCETASWGRRGYKTLFDLLMNTYNGGPEIPNLDIKLNAEVTNIQWSPEGGPVTVTTADGTKYEAENVIVTVSLGVLKEKYPTLFTPELPQEKVNAIRNVSMGLVGKIILSFSEVWWPADKQKFTFLWKGEDKRALGDDWITKSYGATTPMGSSNVVTLWTNGYATRHVETLSDEEVKNKSMELLRRFMGKNITIPEPTGIIRSSWYTNPFTRGTYSFNNVATGEHPQWRDDLAQPLVDSAGKPRVLMAGEATHGQYFSTVHGALHSGRREAERLLAQDKAN